MDTDTKNFMNIITLYLNRMQDYEEACSDGIDPGTVYALTMGENMNGNENKNCKG
jgi:hypothetical protein